MLSDTSPLHAAAYRAEVRRQAALARPHVDRRHCQKQSRITVGAARQAIGPLLARMRQRLAGARAAEPIQRETAALG
jgi:hypothetical protein